MAREEAGVALSFLMPSWDEMEGCHINMLKLGLKESFMEKLELLYISSFLSNLEEIIYGVFIIEF